MAKAVAKQKGRAELWSGLFSAVQALTMAGEITWEPYCGGLEATLSLRADEMIGEKGKKIGAISVVEGDVDFDDTIPAFVSDAATALHRTVREQEI